MRDFVPGLELARDFYEEAVAPLLGETRHSAALLGWGSDVLGFDTARSTDHGWGPRLQLFVEQGDRARVAAALERDLPAEFRGWPTRFGWDAVPVSHHVEVLTLGEWSQSRVGFDPRHGISVREWLITPQQILLEVTEGDVFHDGLGELVTVRDALAWYPEEVWLWLLACQWRRIDQEEPFVGRTADVGDALGSRVIAARLVRDIMRLCFLQERRYAPYGKWLGSAFRQLDARVLASVPSLGSSSKSRPATTRWASHDRSTRACGCSTTGRTASSAAGASSTPASSGSRTPGCGRCRSPARSTSSSTRPTWSATQPAFARRPLSMTRGPRGRDS